MGSRSVNMPRLFDPTATSDRLRGISLLTETRADKALVKFENRRRERSGAACVERIGRQPCGDGTLPERHYPLKALLSTIPVTLIPL